METLFDLSELVATAKSRSGGVCAADIRERETYQMRAVNAALKSWLSASDLKENDPMLSKPVTMGCGQFSIKTVISTSGVVRALCLESLHAETGRAVHVQQPRILEDGVLVTNRGTYVFSEEFMAGFPSQIPSGRYFVGPSFSIVELVSENVRWAIFRNTGLGGLPSSVVGDKAYYQEVPAHLIGPSDSFQPDSHIAMAIRSSFMAYLKQSSKELFSIPFSAVSFRKVFQHLANYFGEEMFHRLRPIDFKEIRAEDQELIGSLLDMIDWTFREANTKFVVSIRESYTPGIEVEVEAQGNSDGVSCFTVNLGGKDAEAIAELANKTTRNNVISRLAKRHNDRMSYAGCSSRDQRSIHSSRRRKKEHKESAEQLSQKIQESNSVLSRLQHYVPNGEIAFLHTATEVAAAAEHVFQAINTESESLLSVSAWRSVELAKAQQLVVDKAQLDTVYWGFSEAVRTVSAIVDAATASANIYDIESQYVVFDFGSDGLYGAVSSSGYHSNTGYYRDGSSRPTLTDVTKALLKEQPKHRYKTALGEGDGAKEWVSNLPYIVDINCFYALRSLIGERQGTQRCVQVLPNLLSFLASDSASEEEVKRLYSAFILSHCRDNEVRKVSLYGRVLLGAHFPHIDLESFGGTETREQTGEEPVGDDEEEWFDDSDITDDKSLE